MSRTCRDCGTVAERDAQFCTECGRQLAPTEIRARSAAAVGAPAAVAAPSLSSEPPQLEQWSSSCAPGAELVVEVETNRQHLLAHASLLRFRVTSNLRGKCDVSIRTRLHAQGRFVEQEANEIDQCCRFQQWGEQYLFSFPFVGLRPGEITVAELGVTVTRPDQPNRARAFELPDKSLFVHVSDPAVASHAAGIVISGGIHLDLSQLREMYGSDIRDLIRLNAQREAEAGQAAIGWEPIRLRFLGERTVDPLPTEICLQLPSGAMLELVRIHAGEFVLGTADGQGKGDERPAHLVQVTRDFYLGKFPITQEQYQAVMASNPTRFDKSPRHPVDNVSGEDAQEFCRRLQSHVRSSPAALSDGTVRAEQARLPTEAEWEYACRAGMQSLYAFGDERSQLHDYGWFGRNAQQRTQPVGQLKPNAWGLHDMHGNVWEWCSDIYAANYSEDDKVDPQGPTSGDRRVLRGGSWNCYAWDCRSASRRAAEPTHATANYGFRVVILLERKS